MRLRLCKGRRLKGLRGVRRRKELRIRIKEVILVEGCEGMRKRQMRRKIPTIGGT